MNIIETMADHLRKEYRKNYYLQLTLEKNLVEYYFDWLKLEIKNGILLGHGTIDVRSKRYDIKIAYSPFFGRRFDRISINNHNIKYDDRIHVYGDSTLCLYHPIFDRPAFQLIPLYKMVPWITEWCILYEDFKKYKVWLGPEVKH
jgi:hypothetical protein